MNENTSGKILIISHQERILNIADRIIMMQDGKVVRDGKPEFGADERPLNFTGEAMFPWMFEQERALRPFKPAMDVLMEDAHFGTIYAADQLARNAVPQQADIY